MKKWLSRLEPREQRIVGLGGLVLLPILTYLAVVEPAYQALDKAESSLASTQSLHQKIAQLASEASALKSRGSSSVSRASTTSLLPELESSLKQVGIANSVKRIAPQGDQGAQIIFESVAFNLLYQWIELIDQKMALEVQAISIRETAQEGMVKVSLTVK